MLKAISLFFLVIVSLASCSGGGGGGDDSDTGSASTGIRILHAAIDAAPVDVIDPTGAIIQTARFAEPKFYSGLLAGPQTVHLTRHLNPAPLFSFNINVEKDQRRTVILFGDLETLGLKSRVILDGRPITVPGDSAAVRVIHGMTGAGTIRASLGGTAVGDLIEFGGESEYVTVPAATQALTVVRGADGRTALTSTLLLQPRQVYSILVAGQMGYYVTSSIYED